MEILVTVSYHYQGNLYPTAIFIHDQMKAYVRAGHQVRAVVTIPWGKRDDFGRRFGPAVRQKEIDGIEHIFIRCLSFSRYGLGGLNRRCCLAALRRHMGKIRKLVSPDVIHAHSLGCAAAGGLLRERLGCPLVVTNHGESRCDEPWVSHPDWIAHAANRADAVGCVSSVLERQLRDLGVTVETEVILNGFHVGAAELPPIAGRPPASLNYTGWLQKLKKLDVTLRAFSVLQKTYSDAFFTVVGKGKTEEEDQAPRKLAKELGLEDRVSFLGYLKNEDAITEMGKARFFVMPSYPEGFGVVYLEAMAMGCITIGTEGQGIADLITSGENGFLVPPDDPGAIVKIITWCVEHPQEADRIAERGRRDALELTWDKNAAQYVRLFETLRAEKTQCE